MKKFLYILLILFIGYKSHAQYWQQQVDYDITATLNDEAHTIKGFEKVTYTNNSPDTLHFISFHIWPNAYKNDATAYSLQSVQNGDAAFYFAPKNKQGYIDSLSFEVNEIAARTEPHPQYIDVIKLVLPSPLPPGKQAVITTPFKVKLPYNFSRGGHDGHTYQITQWYPKPAVYDKGGWHPMPYLNQGEFYSEFGNYKVSITVPQPYIVAASGHLSNEVEKSWMLGKNIKDANLSIPKTKSATTKGFKKVLPKPTFGAETKTLDYELKNAHDFAWFANKDFIVNYDTCKLASGKIIDVFTYYTAAQKEVWKNSVQYCKDAVRFYSAEVGEYPYNTVSAVQGPKSFGGGMEYPTITVISPMPTAQSLDGIIAHEVGHNWFYGILGSNERATPWMDEGINSYYDYKYNALKYNQQQHLLQLLLHTKAIQKTDQPIATAADAFTPSNYSLVAYHKTARWLKLIENKVGEATFKQTMQAYYNKWQFRHPQPEDFKAMWQPVLQQSTDSIFGLLYTKGWINGPLKRGWKIATPFAPATIKNYIQTPTTNLLLVTPAAGYNKYDKLMLGAFITNYKLPPSKLQFLAAPLYATGSKKLTGAGHISYAIYPTNTWQQVKVSMGALHFSKDASIDSKGNKVFENFTRITPSARFTFKEAPGANRERYVEAKSFIIKDNNFSKFVQLPNNNTIYTNSISTNNYYVNQLEYAHINYRTLYPFQYKMALQQSNSFYRVNITGNYFFNYSQYGGLNVRLFGAKYGRVNKTHRLENVLAQPKLLGVTGDEDYTYSNYFLGRTASYANSSDLPVSNDGFAAQQIMIRDGALKMRLDAFPFLQGRSGNWVAAINLNATLPEAIFPPHFPFKLFFDAGTFSEAWNDAYTGSRLLFVGGVQLSLFKDVVNFYAPLIYSKEFKENLKSMGEQNTFWKRLTFSIDIHRINIRNPAVGKLFL